MNNLKKNSSMGYDNRKGLNSSIVKDLSEKKDEPGWMTDFRLKALSVFEKMPMPQWGADLSELDIDDIYYYINPLHAKTNTWELVPDEIKNTFNSLGILEAEQKFLAGVGVQYESEMIYKNLQAEWRDQGVIFCDMDTAIRDYSDLVRKYFSTIIPLNDNKFAALNSAVWSGGSFVYVPSGVKINKPLQAYFRINQQNMGQFERTLIIAEPNSFVHYIEGCSAPLYRTNALHSAVVELVALDNSHIRYTTIQNWSKNVYNLVTKRAIAHKNARVEWVDGNFGSKVTMKYPCIILKGEYASGQILSIAVANHGQHQDSGAKIIHLAPHTQSTVISKSISQNGGRTSYRGLLKVKEGSYDSKAFVQCDALILDEKSRSDTYPTVCINECDVDVGHEASVSSINDEHLWYLMMRCGLTEHQARALLINHFIDIFVNELPMEYAVEINRLIIHEMEGSIG